MRKHWIIEALWIVAVAFTTTILITLSIGWHREPLQIQLHDTYFVFMNDQIFILLFLHLFFGTCFVRQLVNRYQNHETNIIALVTTAILLYYTSVFVSSVNHTFIIILIRFNQAFQIFTLAFSGIMIGKRIGRKGTR